MRSPAPCSIHASSNTEEQFSVAGYWGSGTPDHSIRGQASRGGRRSRTKRSTKAEGTSIPFEGHRLFGGERPVGAREIRGLHAHGLCLRLGGDRRIYAHVPLEVQAL